ncbi:MULTISPECIES: hypothetical protein [unclassified Streptomyces]|uniref:hypothetical protein n=1 Tax=unclassified Streptomyces TaxID=2593676 RepID=UPI0009396605|nr:hypothetical protein [Streptomyces sp. TSRI0281]OKI36963.1 hypothetical protein A6A29_41220 [Streptomyces sp. TSRI0281]
MLRIAEEALKSEDGTLWLIVFMGAATSAALTEQIGKAVVLIHLSPSSAANRHHGRERGTAAGSQTPQK